MHTSACRRSLHISSPAFLGRTDHPDKPTQAGGLHHDSYQHLHRPPRLPSRQHRRGRRDPRRPGPGHGPVGPRGLHRDHGPDPDHLLHPQLHRLVDGEQPPRRQRTRGHCNATQCPSRKVQKLTLVTFAGKNPYKEDCCKVCKSLPFPRGG